MIDLKRVQLCERLWLVWDDEITVVTVVNVGVFGVWTNTGEWFRPKYLFHTEAEAESTVASSILLV